MRFTPATNSETENQGAVVSIAAGGGVMMLGAAFDYGEDCRDAVRDLACALAEEMGKEYGVAVSIGEWGVAQRTHVPLALTVNGADHTLRVSRRSMLNFAETRRKAADGDVDSWCCVTRLDGGILRRQIREAVERQLGLPSAEG